MLKLKKSLGQNLLIDKNIINKILSLTNITNKNILEIGSNDGTFAENFKRSKIVSIEPCKNVAAQLKKKGIKVYIEYFDKNLVKKLKKDYLNFDVIYSANTITHINNLNQVLNNLYKISISSYASK